MIRQRFIRIAFGFALLICAAFPLQAQVPDLVLERFAGPDQVQNVTAICFDDQGRVYVAESHRWRNGVEDNRDHLFWVMEDLASQTVEDRRAMIDRWAGNFAPDYFTQNSEQVIQLEDTDGDGKADRRTVFAADFNDAVEGPAIGLISGFGKIYLANIPNVWALEDADGDGVAEQRTIIQGGFGPRFSLSGHDLHGFAWGPDGKLYFSMGDRGYHLETQEGKVLSNPGAGAVFRCEPDGSEMEIFYHNLRNPQELAFNEFGDLFTVDNNSDQGDKVRVSYLLEGGDTGWHMGHQALTTFKDQIEDGAMGQSPHWLSENLWQIRHEGQPEWILPPVDYLTEGPSGLVFNSGTSLPDLYKNHFLVCDYKGASSQCFVYSFKVERAGAGYVMRDDHVFSSGITAADVDVGYDGKVYLGDFGGGWLRPDTGNIFTLHDPQAIMNPLVKETENLFANGIDVQSSEELAELLSHQDHRVRQRAQFALATRADEGKAFLNKALATNEKGLFPRLQGLWGLRQQKEAETIAPYLADEDPEIRAHSARALGDLKAASHVDEIAKLLGDASPRVRSFAAISLGKLGDSSVFPNLQRMLEENNDSDAYLRHAGIMGLVGVASPSELASLADSPSRAVRIAAVVALRRLQAAEITAFLEDGDLRIRNEVIRAVNDQHVADAYTALIEFSKRWSSAAPDADLPSEILFRRILNIHFRQGSADSARQMALFAVNTHLPIGHRRLALDALALWEVPPPIDPTLGLYHPLPARDPQEATSAVEDPMTELLQSPNINPRLIASATRVAQTFDISIPPSLLAQWLGDRNQQLEVRLAALDQFREEPPRMFRSQLGILLEDPSAEMRAAVAESIAELYPEDAMAMVRRLMSAETLVERRSAIGILSKTDSPEASVTFEDQLEKLAEGHIDPALSLDLYEGAMVRSEESVKTAIEEVDQELEDKGKDIFAFTIQGGDPVRGERIFANQGTCLKCHRVRSGGGTAGPSLFGIASRLSPEQLVESMVDPNRDVVTGYGIVSLTLKDGTTVTGTPLERTETTQLIRTALAEPQEIPLEDIASETPTLSSMPPMALVLPKKDVRDLMAYLQTLVEP